MRLKLSMAVVWYTIGLSGQCGAGTQTLYPITESGPSIHVSRTNSSASGPTNQPVSAKTIAVVLQATAIGPAGARGLAQIRGRSVSLHVSRLEPGQYELQIVRRPVGEVEPLGRLTIVDPTSGPSRQTTDNKKEASANPESVLIQTDVEMKLRSALEPRDIARVQLVGAGGNAVLTGEVKAGGP